MNAPPPAADAPAAPVCGLPAGWAGEFPLAGGAGGECAVQRAGGVDGTGVRGGASGVGLGLGAGPRGLQGLPMSPAELAAEG